MGVEIVRVPPDWHHPVDDDGELIVGAHHEPLYHVEANTCTAFQLYENVSEGSPISPVFATAEDFYDWLIESGWSQEAAQLLMSDGHAPSLVIR